jgi:molecular chaperone DnaK (HSP70)
MIMRFYRWIILLIDCIHGVLKLQALKEANLLPSDITELVMNGGCSNIPKLRKMIRDHFNNLEISELKIESAEVVAYGTALEAAVTSGIV